MSEHRFPLRRILPCALGALAATAVLAFGAQPAGDEVLGWPSPERTAAADAIGFAGAAGAASWDGQPAGLDARAAREVPAAAPADAGSGETAAAQLPAAGATPDGPPESGPEASVGARPDNKALMGALLLGIRQDPRSMSLMLR